MYATADFYGGNYGTEAEGNYLASDDFSLEATDATTAQDVASEDDIPTVTITGTAGGGEGGVDSMFGAALTGAFGMTGEAAGVVAGMLEFGAEGGAIGGPVGAVVGLAIGAGVYWWIEHNVP